MSRLEKALERAKKAREEQGGPSAVSLPLKGGSRPQEAEVDPEYTQTRVLDLDEEFLNERRILTFSTHPAIVEQYNLLKAQVEEAINPRRYRTLMVASANPEEGKTLTAVNLAVSFTRDKTKTVLLVDTDFRRPSISRYFGLTRAPGLYEHLVRRIPLAEALVNPGIPRLTVLPAGQLGQAPWELLSGPAMQRLVREMKERYSDRYIIFDSPPLLPFSDAVYLARHADGVILVVRSGKTREQDVVRAQELLEGRHILGMVLNRVSRHDASWRDYDSYYHHYTDTSVK